MLGNRAVWLYSPDAVENSHTPERRPEGCMPAGSIGGSAEKVSGEPGDNSRTNLSIFGIAPPLADQSWAGRKARDEEQKVRINESLPIRKFVGNKSILIVEDDQMNLQLVR